MSAWTFNGKVEEVIVATPAILTLSKFVCPSTSISPLISKLPNVPTPTADLDKELKILIDYVGK